MADLVPSVTHWMMDEHPDRRPYRPLSHTVP
jgi:hypothetical protein